MRKVKREAMAVEAIKKLGGDAWYDSIRWMGRSDYAIFHEALDA